MQIHKDRFPPGYVLLKDPKPIPRPRVWSRILWLCALFVALSFAIFLSQVAAAQEAELPGPELLATKPNDAEAGQLLFGDSSSGFVQAVHLDTDIEVEINGMVAEVTYQQRFRNDSTDWQEAVYVFPLSENAAVNHMEMIIGDRRILSQIKEREEAKRIYTEAKAAGKRAALTEQQRPNLFTQRVANIGPGEEISVELRFVQRIDYEHGAFEFHLPTTITPRYMPGVATASFEEKRQLSAGGKGWAEPTDQVPDAPEISPPMVSQQWLAARGKSTRGVSTQEDRAIESSTTEATAVDSLINPMSLSIRLNAGLTLANLSSAYHSISQQRSGDAYLIKLAEGRVSMDATSSVLAPYPH